MLFFQALVESFAAFVELQKNNLYIYIYIYIYTDILLYPTLFILVDRWNASATSTNVKSIFSLAGKIKQYEILQTTSVRGVCIASGGSEPETKHICHMRASFLKIWHVVFLNDWVFSSKTIGLQDNLGSAPDKKDAHWQCLLGQGWSRGGVCGLIWSFSTDCLVHSLLTFAHILLYSSIVEHFRRNIFFYKTTLAPSLRKKVRIDSAFLDRGGLGGGFVDSYDRSQLNLSFIRILNLPHVLNIETHKQKTLCKICKIQIKNSACRVFPCHASATY